MDQTTPNIMIERRRLFSGFDGKLCKVDPKLITDGRNGMLIWTMLLLSGSDVFYDSCAAVSADGCKTFSEPIKLNLPDSFEDGIRYHNTITNIYYSHHYDKWIFFGTQHQYSNDKLPRMRDGISLTSSFYGFIDPEHGDISQLHGLHFPFETICVVPHGQIMEDGNGSLLLSFYYKTEECPYGSILTARCVLSEEALQITEIGAPISGKEYFAPDMRGLGEPSVAKLSSKYYLTIRNDRRGYWAKSEDGLHFSEPKPWCFDDGSEIGSYNTMQRWVRFQDALYLIYTRRDRLNGHVFRHRAPLYMTRFDPDRGCLIRDEEIILVPELGARLGNFSVTDLSPTEAVLTVAEWMQPEGCEKYGSDNSVWLVRIKKA